MAKTNEDYKSGQFLTASLSHFNAATGDTVVSAAVSAAATAKAAHEADPTDATKLAAHLAAIDTYTAARNAKLKELVETTSGRATVVIVGSIDDDTGRVAVENNGAWTAATLEAALGGTWTVTDFTY